MNHKKEHIHHHEESCECGHDHHHEESCGCGHDHLHEESCGCGHDHPHEKLEGHKHPTPSLDHTNTASVFIIENLGCAHCAGKMEEQIAALPGVDGATLTYATKQLRVWAPNAESMLSRIQDICTSIEPQVTVSLRTSRKKKGSEIEKDKPKLSEDTKSLLSILFGVCLFIGGKVLESSFPMQSNIVFIVAYLILGTRIVFTALKNISKGQVFDENFLMSIATIGAFIIGDFAEAVGVMLFYRIGELFESKAVARSRSQIMDVIDMRPEVVNLVHGKETTVIDAEEAVLGDILLVRPGDRIPLDGIITEGNSMIDTSPVTGEPVPILASSGTAVTSGCVNTSGQIKIRVEKILEESMVTRIMDSVENAAASKPKMDRFITKFSKVYTPFVVLLALATAIVPSLITGDWNHWIYTALTFLVISCPCALVLSVPLAFFSGIGVGSKRGILFKGGASLETLKNIKSIVMDKTGTITKGNFQVQEIVPIGNYSRHQVLSFAAACEAGSTHPIAKSIMSTVKKEQLNYIPADTVEEIAGHGISITLNGQNILAGNRKLMDLYHVSYEEVQHKSYGTEVLVACDGTLIGYFIISDTLKDDAKTAIASLKSLGLKTVMLTGDSSESAKAIAEETGIDQVFSRLLPDEKLERLQQIRNESGAVMFVGDGINDAPVLAGADCGAAMGSGADAAIEAADVVFMTSNVSAIPDAISIGKKASAIAWQNVIFALAVKALVMILGLTGYANMWMAVFADTGVAMICVINSIRALRAKY